MTSAIAQRFPAPIQRLEHMHPPPSRLPISPGDDALETSLKTSELHQLAHFRHPRPLARPLYGQMPAKTTWTIKPGVEMDGKSMWYHEPVGGVVDLLQLQGVIGEPQPVAALDEPPDG